MYISNYVNLQYSFSKTCQTPALSGEPKLEEAMNLLQDRLCSLSLGLKPSVLTENYVAFLISCRYLIG